MCGKKSFAPLLCAGAFLLCRSAGLAQDPAVINLDFDAEESPAVSEEGNALARAREAGVVRMRVRSVHVEGRWADRVPLPLAPGDLLTADKVSAALAALRAAITAPSAPNLPLRTKGEVGVLYLDVKYETAAAVDANGSARGREEMVDVIFRPHYLRISLLEIGNNILPIPRSGWPTFYEQAPRWLLAFNPTVGFSHDRAFGAAVSLGAAVGLFDPPPEAGNWPRLELAAEGMKSLEETFHRAAGGLRLEVARGAGLLREMSLAADFTSVAEPLGAGEHDRSAGAVSLGGKFRLAPTVRLALEAGYRRAEDSLEDSAGVVEAQADQQTNRLLLDAIPPRLAGFVRAALWQESAWQNNGRAYQRIAIRAGYEREIALAPNQTIGLEVLAGAGHASGGTPAFAQFFGGNAAGQFLYDPAEAAALRAFPGGPILRSFGENEARLSGPAGLTSGGRSFWHLNLSLSLPVPPWSRSLIPNELTDVEDAQGRPVSIKQLLKQQISVTGPSMLRAVLKREGLSAAAAEREAKNVFREITPATRFLIEDANLFALKPLLMFDAAGLTDGNGRSETWTAAGGGLQVTVVTAKLEAGYMRTLSGPRQGHDGNAFVRLIFQNLF